jgi:hypothetical protein
MVQEELLRFPCWVVLIQAVSKRMGGKVGEGATLSWEVAERQGGGLREIFSQRSIH